MENRKYGNIYLIGNIGVGKTTLSEKLSKVLNMKILKE